MLSTISSISPRVFIRIPNAADVRQSSPVNRAAPMVPPNLPIVAAATAGKFGGTLVAARLSGLGWRKSAALGTLMNTRGLMELIALNLGLDLGVITPTVFTMMVLMALITTFSATPVLDLLLGKRGFEEEAAPVVAASHHREHGR